MKGGDGEFARPVDKIDECVDCEGDERVARQARGVPNTVQFCNAEHLRLRNAKARGEVCTIGEVVQVLCEMVAGFTLTLKQSEYTIAEEASGVEVGEAVKRVKKRHHEALETLALGEWAQKKTFWSMVSAELSDRLKTLAHGPGPKTT